MNYRRLKQIEQLTGNFKDFWRFRIGAYRVVFKLEEQKPLILVVRVAHRKEVYLDEM